MHHNDHVRFNNHNHPQTLVASCNQTQWHMRMLWQNATITIDFKANSKNKQPMATTFNRLQNNLTPNQTNPNKNPNFQ
jgi:hypothetical protein